VEESDIGNTIRKSRGVEQDELGAEEGDCIDSNYEIISRKIPTFMKFCLFSL
jgi:hypothetical protein